MGDAQELDSPDLRASAIPPNVRTRSFFTISDKEWLNLERAELAALKMSLGITRYAMNDLVYQEAGWLPLREECCLRCAHFEARCFAMPNTVMESLGKGFARSVKRNSLARKHPRVSKDYSPLGLQPPCTL